MFIKDLFFLVFEGIWGWVYLVIFFFVGFIGSDFFNNYICIVVFLQILLLKYREGFDIDFFNRFLVCFVIVQLFKYIDNIWVFIEFVFRVSDLYEKSLF